MEPLDIIEIIIRVFCVWFVVSFGLLIIWAVMKEIGYSLAKRRARKELCKFDSTEESTK